MTAHSGRASGVYRFDRDEWRVIQSRLHADRFWSKVDKANDCWIWTASTFRHGYGTFWLNTGRGESLCTHAAHRVAFEIQNGPIPPSMVVMHVCDTPLCVRPDHLRLGTTLENQQDMTAKGRGRRGPRNGRCLLSEADVVAIRSRRASGETYVSLAKSFGASVTAVRLASIGRNWRHLR